MSIDDRALADLTDEVDRLHHESMRSFREEAHEIHFGDASNEPRESRRELIRKAGAGGALLTVGALAGPVSRFLPAAFAAEALDDATIAKFAASVEFTAVAVYRAAIDSDKLSASVARVARTFLSHHRDHGRAFNDITKATSEKPNPRVLAAYNPRLRSAADQNAVLEVAYAVEEAAAATYLFALGVLQDKSNAKATASILPVESQHAVVLAQVLERKLSEYLPAFQNDRLALRPSEYPV